MKIRRAIRIALSAATLLAFNSYGLGQLPQESNTRFSTPPCQAEGRIPFSTLNVTPPFWQPVCDAGIRWDNTAKRLDLNLTQGSVLFINASGQVEQDNANFFWNAAATMLGIGIGPAADLHVSTAANFPAVFASTDDLSQVIINDDDTTGFFGVKDAKAFFGLSSGLSANNVQVDASGNARALTLESDVATGTAPLVVASTTEVANLRAATATALAANGANCAGNDGWATGVDASGAGECSTSLITNLTGVHGITLDNTNTGSGADATVKMSSGVADYAQGINAADDWWQVCPSTVVGGSDCLSVDDNGEMRFRFTVDRYNTGFALVDGMVIADDNTANSTFLSLTAISTKTILQSGSQGSAADQDLEILTNARGTDRTFTFDTAGLFTSDDMATGSMNFDDATGSIKYDGTTKIDLFGAGGGVAIHADVSPGDATDSLGRSKIVGNSWGDIFVSLPTSSETTTVCYISGTDQLVQCNSPPEEFKENWRDLSIDPRGLLGLTTREFDYVRNDQGRDFVRTNLKGFGYSTQRLAELGIPGLVSPDGSSVNKSVLIPLLIELLKDQDSRIDELEARR